MDLPIYLRTEYATKMFHILNEQYKFHKDTNLEFKERCKQDYDLIRKYFTYFLEHDKMIKEYRMDDYEFDNKCWTIYNELSELCYVLKYFKEL